MSTFSSREALTKAEGLAVIDGLTGLQNVTEFSRRMSKAFESFQLVKDKIERGAKLRRGDKYLKAISIVMFDIDDFKNINETYGHMAANEVLKSIGGILKLREREADCAARFGGDEFSIGFVGMTEEKTFHEIKELKEALKDLSVVYEGQRVPFTMSFGITSTENASSFVTAMEQADQALKDAKSAGKNGISRYSSIEKKAQKSSVFELKD
ncbi:MAG: GGDEF domain-containing protein [Candidatus Kaiserbacteria bacterium]|nr:GGDEF domain-containing protein [Candidatus Kaiserbacteria bacterium]